MLSQRTAIGNEVKISKRIVLCNEVPRRVSFLAPKAWPQMGSMPMARPDRIEYPVMLAKPTARAPPARWSLPRWPRKSKEIMDRE